MTDMCDVDHTNPHTGEPFGGRFRRGVVAADGGHDPAREDDPATEDDADDEQMEDVSHESPSEGANRAFERGTEGRTDSV